MLSRWCAQYTSTRKVSTHTGKRTANAAEEEEEKRKKNEEKPRARAQFMREEEKSEMRSSAFGDGGSCRRERGETGVVEETRVPKIDTRSASNCDDAAKVEREEVRRGEIAEENAEERLFVPHEEIERSRKRDWRDGIAGRTLAESGFQNVERRKVVEPPRKNHGIFPGARLPRDEAFFKEEGDEDSPSSTKRLERLPQYMSETERFRKIDLAEEQKRERETLRAKREHRDHLRRLRNAEREQLNQEKERLAQEMEESRLHFKRTHIGNRPNKSGCGWDPVNMKLNDGSVREQDLKEEQRMRAKREMMEKRTYSESFDIVTHLERTSCASANGNLRGGEISSSSFIKNDDFVGI